MSTNQTWVEGGLGDTSGWTKPTLVQLTGSNVAEDGSVKLASLSKDIDSIDVGKMSKGGASAAFTTSGTGSSGEINCSGYNSVIVYITPITGTWDISVQGSTVSGGTFIDSYDDRNVQMKAAGITTARSVMFRGVLDYMKIVATNVAAGSVTVKVVPINV